jgi:hypothetical protein
LERELATFSRECGVALHEAAERDADIFALDWLVPPWRLEQPPTRGLTAAGQRLLLLRAAFGAAPVELDPAAVESLNRAGEAEARRHSGEDPPQGGTRWGRAAWLLWNREWLRGSLAGSGLLDRYDAIVGDRSRRVPELRADAAEPVRFDPSRTWLPRLEADAASAVDGVHWTPLLLARADPLYPLYNIPIRPLPSRRADDSRLPWSHMLKSVTQRARPLEEWIAAAEQQGAGLLLFPRTPAERALDAIGVPRP